MNNNLPKITFGIIVLNGEPFTRYCLKSIYPYAHEIIVVEGGHIDARSVCTPEGHSVDGTLETLYKFKKEEDPENKLTIVTRDGFWPKKDELGMDRTPQSRAYAERATGDYLWQIDIDEFYREEDMVKILEMLDKNPKITAVTFQTINFWGDINLRIDGWNLRRGAVNFHRLFKWGKGYRYVTHEPPTIVNHNNVDLRKISWIKGKKLQRKGIYMYHYSHLFPWQVKQKTLIYNDEKHEGNDEILKWAENNYFKLSNPFNIERHFWLPSWLEYYKGSHPKQILQMMDDIKKGNVDVELRGIEDAVIVLNRRFYNLKVFYMKRLNTLDYYTKYFIRQALRIQNVPGVIKRNIKKAIK